MKGLQEKRILVTGAAGFVGAHLVRQLIADDAQVHAVVRPGSDMQRIADISDRITLHEVDLTDAGATRSLVESVDPQGVFHLAALNASYDTQHTPEVYRAVNETMPIHLMNLMRNRTFDFFVHTDTFAVVAPKTIPITEKDELNPQEPYGKSRIKATAYAQELGAQGLPYVVIRVFTPYGPLMHREPILARIITWALKNEEMQMTDPSITRDFIYIDDLVDIYIRAALRAQRYPGHVFNGGAGKAITLETAVNAIMAATGSTSVVRWGSERAVYDGGCIQADLTKVRSYLGWEPRHSFADGLKPTIAWLRTQL